MSDAPPAMVPTTVFCVGGQAVSILAPADSAQFWTWVKIVRSDGMIMLGDAVIPWHAIVSILRGDALASMVHSIAAAQQAQLLPGERPN